MEGSETIKERLVLLWKKMSKYRYAALIALIGIALMLMPGKSNSAKATEQTELVRTTDSFCNQLEKLLSQIKGAGKVSCLVSCSEGLRNIYQTDTTQSANGEVKVNTVLVSTGSGTEAAVSVGTIEPVYRGVVVVCDGADSAQIRLEITQAVSALTGLSSDKIAVVKGKGTP